MRTAELLGAVSGALDDLARRPADGPHETAWERTMARVDRLPARRHLRLAGLLREVDFGAGSARRWMSEMRFEKRLKEEVARLVEEPGPGGWDLPAGELSRYVSRLGREAAEDHLILQATELAVRGAGPEELGRFAAFAALVRDRVASRSPLTVRELELGGADLVEELGVPAGPLIGELLRALLDHVMDHPEENTRDGLLRRARSLLGDRNQR
jgi:tRNA nucleotidyltransferase (CCA-adding enzyme)